MTAEKKTFPTVSVMHYIMDSFDYASEYLDRDVKVDVYLPKKATTAGELSLLFVNDGQDLPKMPFDKIIDDLAANGLIKPLMVVAMHCSPDRKLEYGTADVLDFMNRGSRAKYHRKFLLRELMPHVLKKYGLNGGVKEMAYAGFSLGGLSALDVAWKHANLFSKVGVFSGSLWWRLRDLDDDYSEETDRIMHNLIRDGKYHKGQKFFFQTGILDEKMDRNNNGIIDSIDDTLTLIDELVAKGYDRETDIHYLELSDGRHDVPTWGRAFPAFLQWGWGTPKSELEK